MRYWQINKTFLSRLRITVVVMAVLAFLYILPSLIFLLPSVQREAGRRIGDGLRQLLGTEVYIGRVGIEGWLDLTVEQVQVLDSLARPAVQAERLLASVDLGELLTEGRLRIGAIRLFSPSICLVIDSHGGGLNIQPILERLTSQDDSPASLVVDINTVILRDATVSLARDERGLIEVQRLDAKLRRLSFGPERFSGTIDDLSLATSTGFRIEELSAQLEGRGDTLQIKELSLDLPSSHISLPRLELHLQHSGLGILEAMELEEASISILDFAPLYPKLADIGAGRLSLQTRLNHHDSKLEVEELMLRLDRRLHLQSQGRILLDSLGGLSGCDLHTSPLKVSSALLDWLPIIAPDVLSSQVLERLGTLGEVSYQGRLQIDSSRLLSIDGLLQSTLGRWQTFLAVERTAVRQEEHLSLKLSTPHFDLSPLLGASSEVGHVIGAITLEANRPDSLSPWRASGLAEIGQLAYQGHTYQGLSLQLEPVGRGRHRVSFSSTDPRLSLEASASFGYTQDRLHDLEASIDARQIDLGLLLPEQPTSTPHSLSLEAEARLTTLDPRDLEGKLALHKLSLMRATDSLALRDLEIQLERKDHGEQHLSAQSPWGHLHLRGHYSMTDLGDQVRRSLENYAPWRRRTASPPPILERQPCWATLRLQVDSLPRHLDRYLGIDLALNGPLRLSGQYREAHDDLGLNLSGTGLELDGYSIRHLEGRLSGRALRLAGHVTLPGGGQLRGAEVRLEKQGDSLELRLDLGREHDGTINGGLHLSSHFVPQSERIDSWRDLRAQIDLHPSTLRIHSALWQVSPAQIRWQGEVVEIEGLQISTEGRSLSIHGAVGNRPTDEIVARLERINLRYILEAAGIDFTMIETDLTGEARARLEAGVLHARAEVTSPHFYLSGYDAAAIGVHLDWNSQDMRLNLRGQLTQPSGGASSVAGHIRLETPAGIDLNFQAQAFDLGFTHVFLDSFLSHISGKGSGQIRLFGAFEQGVTIAGEADVRQAAVGVKLLGTTYYFDHRLRFDPNRMHFDGIRLRDDLGHTGVLTGYVGHNHFGDFDIQLRAHELDGLKVLQTSTNRDLPVYGTAYGSGWATLSGDTNRLSIDLGLRSEAGTELTLDFNPVQIGREEGLMRFKSLRAQEAIALADTVSSTQELPMALDMKLNLAVTPEAKVTMRLGYDATNEIKGRCEGSLMVNVPSLGEPTVFGNLNVTEGLYTFRLEQLAHKRFRIAEGGQMLFRGDPLQANLNLKAIYALTANIADLDEDLALDVRRSNIPVHCVLGISGLLTQPNIAFALELPGADTELERRMRSLLNTEDAVTRQMLYLIALGKFYTPEALDKTGKSSTSNWAAVASSALSEQLSYLLGNLSETIHIGTNIKTRNTAFEDTDIELLLSGSWFDNRLLINANVGYHDSPLLSDTYLGEFDIEYRLNRSGSLRLKGYNHYNQMYQYLRQGLMTQGLGVLFRQRFDHLSELLGPTTRHRRLYTPKANGLEPVPLSRDTEPSGTTND